MRDAVFVVAEMANAHGGDLESALKIVDASADAGADAIKYQVFFPEELAVPSHTHFDSYRELQMPEDHWHQVIHKAQKKGLVVFADVFGPDSVGLVTRLGVDGLMIHAADVGNDPLLELVGAVQCPMLVSTGGSTWIETAHALSVLRGAGAEDVVLIYGFQGYPTDFDESNLRRLGLLRSRFGLPVGFASHVDGGSPEAIGLPSLAAAAGADLVEVHITLDRSKKGHDYYSSLDPDRFREMVERLRRVAPCFGRRDWGISAEERKYRETHRKWLVTEVDLRAGDVIERDMIALKRVEKGSSDHPVTMNECIGRSVVKAVGRHSVIQRTDICHKAVAALACRAESTRLFGKPLQLLGKKPIISHLIDQLRRVDVVEEVVLAISEGPSSSLFVEYAGEHGLPYVIGAGRDVLGRIIAAADSVGGDIVLRTTTENAFIYWENLDELVGRHISNGNDLTVTEQLPIAAFVEVISLDALKRAHQFGEDRHRSEFVTQFIAENPDSFRIERIAPPENLKRPNILLAIDGPEDLVVLRQIWNALQREDQPISLSTVVAYIDQHPEVAQALDAGETLYFWK